MQVPKPTDDDKDAFRSLVPERPNVEVKPMFGNLGAFVNGNMFMGLFGSSIGVKLPDADRHALLELPGSGPYGPTERPMGGYVSLPPAWRDGRDDATRWIARALDYVSAMPPKAGKTR